MQGRCHCYEGYSAERATFPVRVMNTLGVELLIVSNAAGGLNPNFACGDVMVIDDHINLLNRNPLVGVNDDKLGPRFPDMSAPYDRRLGDRALAIARKSDFVCHRGVYAAMLGPTYETRAEIRMLRYFCADAVGMSTVPEVILARFLGLRVAACSVITNLAAGMTGAELSHAETRDMAPLGGARLAAGPRDPSRTCRDSAGNNGMNSGCWKMAGGTDCAHSRNL